MIISITTIWEHEETSVLSTNWSSALCAGPSNAAVEESSEPQIKRAKVETNGVTRAASPPSEAPTSTSTTKGEFEHTPETAARFCELFCALCTKRHALLDDLFSTFGESKNVGRAAIMRNAEGLARVLGPQAPALLKLVASPPPGSMPLLLKMLNFLTESQHPPEVFFPFHFGSTSLPLLNNSCA